MGESTAILGGTTAASRANALWWACALLLGAAAVLILVATQAEAQCSGGPANNCFANAGAVGATPWTTSQSTAGATMEASEPSPCGAIGSTVWFSWTPTTTGQVTMTTVGSSYDTVVAAYTGTSVGGLAQQACNDDFPSCCLSQITFNCTAGTTYMIQAGGFSAGTGNLQLNVGNCSPPPPPFCGYTITTGSSVYTWDEISSTGTPISGFFDYTIQNVPSGPAPFPFNLCGTDYSYMFPVSKGHVCLGTSASSNSCSSCCPYNPPANVPSPSTNKAAIYGVYADIYPGGCSGGSSVCMFYKVMGTAPNRVLVYEWKQVPFFSCCYPGPLTFEIKLFETSNCIEVQFNSVSGGSGYNKLSGFQDGAGQAGYSNFYGSAAQTLSATGWRACPIPPFQAIDDAYTLNEDSAVQALDVTANDLNSVPGGLTITDVGPAALGTVAISGGDLLYTPYANTNGVDTLTYTIENANDDTDTGTVVVTVNAVNDAPSLVASTTPIILTPASGAQAFPGWGTLVEPGYPGASDETPQQLTFTLTVDDMGIFAGPPVLERTLTATSTEAAATGDFAVLRFTPSGQPGNATVCFRVHDDGGTATVTDSWGASVTGVDTAADTRCVAVLENAPPTAYFEPSTDHATPGQQVTFNTCPGPVPHCSFDPDGGIVSFTWEFGDGDGSSMMMPSHSYASTGVYAVRLTVMDGYGMQASTQRMVTAEWGDSAPVESPGPELSPPVSDAGEGFSAVDGTVVALAGSQSGGDESTTFEWLQASGPTVKLENATHRDAWFIAPVLTTMDPVDLVFSLRATEGDRVGPLSFLIVHIVSGNHLPVADAGGAKEAAPGATVMLDGSRSSDPDSDTLTYLWDQDLVPGDVWVQLSDPKAAQPTFTAPPGTGMMHFRLHVSDGKSWSEDHATVVVRPEPAHASDALNGDPAPNAAAPQAARLAATGAVGWPALASVAGGFLLVALLIVAVALRRRGSA